MKTSQIDISYISSWNVSTSSVGMNVCGCILLSECPLAAFEEQGKGGFNVFEVLKLSFINVQLIHVFVAFQTTVKGRAFWCCCSDYTVWWCDKEGEAFPKIAVMGTSVFFAVDYPVPTQPPSSSAYILVFPLSASGWCLNVASAGDGEYLIGSQQDWGLYLGITGSQRCGLWLQIHPRCF